MKDTIFSKILAGEIPCQKVYENDLVFSFLDIQPLSPGHTLVIPKRAAPTLDLLDDESASALGLALPKISRAVLKAVGAKDFNVLQNNGANANQSVFHVHFHIIPKMENGAGLKVQWKPGELPKDTDMARRISGLIA